MPYRRLPNTDIARLKALKSAMAAGVEIPPFKLAFSQSTFQKLRNFYTSFEQMMHQQKASFISQSAKSKELGIITRKAKLYISHFYQVLNFAIMRGEIMPAARKFYGLRENDSRLPNLNSEKNIIFWGDKLIKGEAERILKGGNQITNPTAAVVKVRYDLFIEAIYYQKMLQKTTAYASDKISAMRAEADNIILSVWNEVEVTFDILPEEARRNKAEKYGVVYIFRPNERYELQPSEVTKEQETEEFISEAEMEKTGLQQDRKDILEHEKSEKQLNEELQYSILFTKN